MEIIGIYDVFEKFLRKMKKQKIVFFRKDMSVFTYIRKWIICGFLHGYSVSDYFM